MGNQANNFAQCLLRAGLEVLDRDQRKATKRSKATTSELPRVVADELLELYRRLGGRACRPSFTTGDWDIACGDGLLIEYDEEAHFNRYRLVTLDLSWGDQLPWSHNYRDWSLAQEPACTKKARFGGYWSNDSTERMFGPSDPPGVLGTLGSSRWKQRAFYDAVKDAFAVFTPGIALARVSMYDEIGGAEAGITLKRSPGLGNEALRRHILSRTVTGTAD
ncbi:hypothetical protein PTW37_06635 [Arthrobacter agilis]|uniref:DUF7255 family protein n=1 Tax=Arthrobacter agilis TaxID=37921 RepID=UPI002366DF0A|nr:hypothetical protein [Arthrobacter agilis]WDF34571.1 hypothetical protein PTW37_06635 [Arthrobacter agilis]